MSDRRPTEETFLKDVREHVVTIVRDDGVHRHVTFGKPGTSNMRFHLITWPGELCFTGDMGTFVFNRLEDMFAFFRTSGHAPPGGDGQSLYVNRGYWAEKLVACCRDDGHEEFDPDAFRAAVVHRYRNHLEGVPRAEWDPDLKMELRDHVLAAADEGEHEAFTAAMGFEHNGFELRDFWEDRCKRYTYRFVWCCYALAWGIRQYDLAKAPKAAVAA